MWSRFFGASEHLDDFLLLKSKANHRFNKKHLHDEPDELMIRFQVTSTRSWTKAWGYECPSLYVGVSPRWPVLHVLRAHRPPENKKMEPEKGPENSPTLKKHLQISNFGVPCSFFGGVSLYKVGWCRRTLQNHHQKCGCTMRCEFLWQCEKPGAWPSLYWGFGVVWHDLQRSLKQVIVLSVTSIIPEGKKNKHQASMSWIDWS